jgi:hypothetical protein
LGRGPGRARGPPYLGAGWHQAPDLDQDAQLDLYLLWRHTGGRVEPRVAWKQWPAWQFDLLTAGLKEELEVMSNASDRDGAPDPLARAESRAPDWDEADGLLEDLGEGTEA